MSGNGIKENIINFYRDDVRRFHLAQLLFIFSITFGWYMKDGYRRGLFLAALLLLDRRQRKAGVICRWEGLTRTAGFLLIALWAWVTFVPVVGAVPTQTFADRIQGTGRPLEVFLYCYGVMIFAKDKFFEKHLYHFAVLSALFLSVVSFAKRASLSFSIERADWLFGMQAAIAGILLCYMAAWLLVSLGDAKTDKRMKKLCAAALVLTIVSMFVTYCRSIWVAFAAQLIVAVFIACCCLHIKLSRHKKFFVLILLFFVIGFLYAYHVSLEVRQNVEDFMAIGSSFEKFSSNRGEVWADAVSLIAQRKWTGYGWVSYNDFAAIKQYHPHSSYLQAAFCAGIPSAILYAAVLVFFFLLSLRNLFYKVGPPSVSFFVALMITATAVAGTMEIYFYLHLYYLVPFWSMMSMLLSPLYLKDREGAHDDG